MEKGGTWIILGGICLLIVIALASWLATDPCSSPLGVGADLSVAEKNKPPRGPKAGRHLSSPRRKLRRGSVLEQTDSAPSSPSQNQFRITTTTLPMGIVGKPYRQKLKAVGGKGDLTWRSGKGDLPPGLKVKKEGVLAGTPKESGEWGFFLAVEDSSGNVIRREYKMIVRLTDPAVEGIVISTTKLPPALLGREYQQKLSAWGGYPPLTWSIISGSLPPDLRLQPAQGIIYGLARQLGSFQVVIGVTDKVGRSTSANFNLLVEEGIFRIITEALPPASGAEDYQITLRAQGGSPPYAWRVLGGSLPPGFSLHPARGILKGKPEEEGEFEFIIQARDQQGREAERTFVLKITSNLGAGGLYGGFFITTRELEPGTRGLPYSQQLEATGGNAPYTWSISLGDLPPSMFLRSASGELTGIPEKPGIFGFRVLAVDREGLTAQSEFQLLINYELVHLFGLVPGDTDKVEVRVGQEYEFLVGVTGGQEPYTFELEKGFLPNFMGLNTSTGIISGRISDEYAENTRFDFQIKVKDQADGEVVGEYKIDVLIAPTPSPTPEGTEVPATPTPWSTATPIATPSVAGTVSTPVPTPGWSELSISELSGAVGSGRVGLGWSNPSGGLSRVLVVRRHDRFPTGPEDGVVFNAGKEESFLDEGLEDEVPCYYAILAQDDSGLSGRPDANNTILLEPQEVLLAGPNDPFADLVISFSPLDDSSSGNPDRGLGAPRGAGSGSGSLDVVSLQAARDNGGGGPYGGSITVKFDNLVFNGPGDDFTVFENVFYIGGNESQRWMEPAIVYVSKNGINWKLFSFNYFPTSDLSNPYNYLQGFAGVEPVFSNGIYPDPSNPAVSGGDQFDLDEVGLEWIQYIKLLSTGDRWLVDPDGDEVRHTDLQGALSGVGSSGFDLDAFCAIEY